MKKYFCDRCGTPLTNEEGVVPHYNMKDPICKHLRKKNENFVCVPCIDKANREKELKEQV